MTDRRTPPLNLALAALLAFIVFGPLAARAGTTTADVVGTVKDAGGKPVTEAEILMVHKTMGTRMTLKTDAKGKFVQIGLKPGQWVVTVKKAGYSVAEQEVPLRLGTRLPLDIVIAAEPAGGGGDGGTAGGGGGFALGDLKLSAEAAKAYQEAQTALGAGNKEAARAALEQVTRLEPAVSGAWFMLAQLQRDAGAGAEAVASLGKGLALAPSEVAGWIALGELESEAGRAAESAAAYQKATEAAPNDPRGYRKLGMALLVRGDFAAAQAALEKYLALAPDAADAAEKKILIEECKKLGAKPAK